jgi:hypothetical protein
VQRRQGRALLDRPDDRIGDADALGELLGPVDEPMADRLDVLHVGDHGQFAARQFLDHEGERRLVIGRRDGGGLGLAGGLVDDPRAGLADLLDEAGGEDRAFGTIFHMKQGILDARRPAVHDQDVHVSPSPFQKSGAGPLGRRSACLAAFDAYFGALGR